MIFLKRFIVFAVIGSILFSLSACKEKTEFVFRKQGIYFVTEEGTDISFKASIGERHGTLNFTSPPTLKGLTVNSDGAGDYTLEYSDIKVSLGSFAVKTGESFFAAMDCLEQAGNYKDGVIYAAVDGIEVKGIIKDEHITELYFTDGMENRKYIITTEATVWKTVQKQG